MTEEVITIPNKRQSDSDILSAIGKAVETMDLWIEARMKKLLPPDVWHSAMKNNDFMPAKHWMDINNIEIRQGKQGDKMYCKLIRGKELLDELVITVKVKPV